MTEPEAREKASELAQRTGKDTYVLTNKQHPGHDYDVVGTYLTYPNATLVVTAKPDGTFVAPHAG